MHSHDIRRKTLPTFNRRRAYARAAEVYKSTEVNTNPRKKPDQPREEAVVKSDVLEELEKVMHHLQQVIMKLRGKV
jgi:hypothetical protein